MNNKYLEKLADDSMSKQSSENPYLDKIAATIDMGRGSDGVFHMTGYSSGHLPVPAGAPKVTPMPNPRAGTALANPMKIGVAKPALGLGGKLLRGAGLLGVGALAANALFGGKKDSDEQ